MGLLNQCQQLFKRCIHGGRGAIERLAYAVAVCVALGGFVGGYGSAQAQPLPPAGAAQQPIPVGPARTSIGSEGLALVQEGWSQIIHGGEPLFAPFSADSKPVGSPQRTQRGQQLPHSGEPVYQIVIEHRSVQLLVTFFLALLLGVMLGTLIRPMQDMFGYFWDVCGDWIRRRR